MNFFETYSEDNTNQCKEAAKAYIDLGWQVLPLLPGEKIFTRNIKQLSDIRQHPINHHNLGFYFTGTEELALIIDDRTEYIDVDEKNMPGIAERFDSGLRQQNPDLYDRLVKVQTKTGGSHFIYRSHVTGGDQALAFRAASPNPVVIIEKLSTKNYVKAPPSKGYSYVKGTPEDVQYITPEERMWLIQFARSFNQLIKFESVKKFEQKRDDSPWTVFNSKNDYKYILDQLLTAGWTIVADRDQRILMKRPGDSQSRTSGAILKESNTLWMFSTSSIFPAGKHLSSFDVYCHLFHDGKVQEAMRMLAENGTGKMKYDEGEFWKDGGNGLQIKYDAIREYLHAIGYRRHPDEFMVQIVDNIVHIISPGDLHRLLIEAVEDVARDRFYPKVKSIFDETSGLYSMLEPLEDKFIRDDRNNTWLFFRNCAVQVSKEGITKTEYLDIPGYIWKSHIIDRDFEHEEWEGCDTDRFISILGGDDLYRLKAIIGYMISDYKDVVNPKCVLITEDIDVEQEGESHGGSGKSLLIDFIKHLRKTCQIDGKNFNTLNPFVWQNVNPDTSLVYIDDVAKGFRLEKLYSIITGSWQLNKKYKEEIIIPFHRSPKLVLTSNYAIGTTDDSTKRRIHNFPVVKHFSAEKQPFDEFGRAFFHEWDAGEWNRYYNYMAHCAQIYLKSDRKLVAGNIRYNERALMNETSETFVEYMDMLLASNFHLLAPPELKTLRYMDDNGSLHTNGVDVAAYDPDIHRIMVEKNVFLNQVKEKIGNPKLTMTQLTYWMKAWAKHRDVVLDTKFRQGREQKLFYRVVQWSCTMPIQPVQMDGVDTTWKGLEDVGDDF